MPKLLALVLALSGCATVVRFQPDPKDGFHREAGAPYFVYVPNGLSADQHPPLIVYLHGGAERGSDGVLPTQVGLGPVVQASHGTFPFVVIFPQAPDNTYWGMPDNNAKVLKAIDETVARYHVDPHRIYLTGNSLGGFGTWFMGALYADRFAALVPICGGVRGRAPKGAPFADYADGPERVREVVKRIGKTPVWAFHGAADWLVPVAYSRELVQALKDAGGNVRYTEFPGVGHASWVPAYADPALFTWLGEQHKD